MWPPVACGRSCQTLHVLLSNTCLGSLLAHVGTWPCHGAWLCPAMLFQVWCANAFWPALGCFPVTLSVATGVLAVFCRFWAAGMLPQHPHGPWGYVPPKVCGLGCPQAQSGHPGPNRRRCSMGAKTPISHFRGVVILTCKYSSAHDSGGSSCCCRVSGVGCELEEPGSCFCLSLPFLLLLASFPDDCDDVAWFCCRRLVGLALRADWGCIL